MRRISIKNRNFLNSLREEINRVAMMRRKPISPKLSISFSIGLTPKEPLISWNDHRKLGAIIAEGMDEEKNFKTNVGSGFTDLQREEFWEEKESLIGQIIEIRADSISKSQDGKNWSLRFPRFKSFRGFEKKEKL